MNCPPVCNLPIFDSIPGAKWPHQKDHRPGHPKFCARNCWHQRFYHLYHLPRRYSEIKYWISEIHAIQILRKLWGLSFPTLSWSSRTWRSISHLRFRWELVESKQLTCTICLTNVNFQQVLDDKNVRRRFRASNYQSTTRWASRDSKVTNCYFRVKPFICTMPMRLDDGWNQIQVQE